MLGRVNHISSKEKAPFIFRATAHISFAAEVEA